MHRARKEEFHLGASRASTGTIFILLREELPHRHPE